MLPKIALTINSHSSNIECLKLFFICMEKFIGKAYFNNIYLFIDKSEYIPPSYITTIYYNPSDSFKDQMIYCLQHVKEEVLLYCNEDYLFYAPANLQLANTLLQKLIDDDSLSFMKFVHTDIEEYIAYEPKLYLIDKNCKNNFSQTLSFWKTKDILTIHEHCPQSEIGQKGNGSGHLEVAAQNICRNLNIKGVCYYNGEPKRGMVHFDTEVFPHIASAIIKGKWCSSYRIYKNVYPELASILVANNIKYENN